MARAIPDISIPLMDANGRMSLDWYIYFKSRETVGLSDLPDVLLDTLSDTEVLIWNSTDGKWENGSN